METSLKLLKNSFHRIVVLCTECVCAYAAAFFKSRASVSERHVVSSFQKTLEYMKIFVGFGVFVAFYENSVFI